MKNIFKSPPNTKFGSVVRKVEHVIDMYGIFNGNETNTRGFFLKKKAFFLFFSYLIYGIKYYS